MIEPYLIDIAIEILKALGGILVPVITTAAILYKRKIDLKFQATERKFEKSEVQHEIDKYINFAGKLKGFETMPIEDKIQAIKDDILIFIQDNGIVISETEIRLMIEKALTMPKSLRYRLLKEAKNELV